MNATDTQNEQLTEYTMTLIHHKARQLVGKAGYTQNDVEDIEQDLIQDLLERMPKFDPARATLNTFADRVIGSRVCNLLRHRQTEMRDCRREAFSLNEEIETEDGPMERHETVSQDEIDLRTDRYTRPAAERDHFKMDLKAVIAGLPPELREVADMLRSSSVAEVARALNIPRRTLRDKHLAQLREVFAASRMNDYLR
jgi:RNA polymerase sigma-70 factor (ECF subfamily)